MVELTFVSSFFRTTVLIFGTVEQQGTCPTPRFWEAPPYPLPELGGGSSGSHDSESRFGLRENITCLMSGSDGIQGGASR